MVFFWFVCENPETIRTQIRKSSLLEDDRRPSPFDDCFVPLSSLTVAGSILNGLHSVVCLRDGLSCSIAILACKEDGSISISVAILVPAVDAAHLGSGGPNSKRVFVCWDSIIVISSIFFKSVFFCR
jgi:hypothetical protein